MSAYPAGRRCRRSGVAKTTLYRHFGTTDGLVFAAVDDSVTAQLPPDTGTLRGDLESIHRRYLDVAASRQSRELFAWMVAKSIESAENRDLFRRVRAQPRGPTTVALQRAIARGEVDADINVDMAMHVIQGPLISPTAGPRSPARSAPFAPSDAGKFTSIRWTERLAEIGARPSIGSVADCDNALAASRIGPVEVRRYPVCPPADAPRSAATAAAGSRRYVHRGHPTAPSGW